MPIFVRCRSTVVVRQTKVAVTASGDNQPKRRGNEVTQDARKQEANRREETLQ